jgi:hypothetical protein
MKNKRRSAITKWVLILVLKEINGGVELVEWKIDVKKYSSRENKKLNHSVFFLGSIFSKNKVFSVRFL